MGDDLRSIRGRLDAAQHTQALSENDWIACRAAAEHLLAREASDHELGADLAAEVRAWANGEGAHPLRRGINDFNVAAYAFLTWAQNAITATAVIVRAGLEPAAEAGQQQQPAPAGAAHPVSDEDQQRLRNVLDALRGYFDAYRA